VKDWEKWNYPRLWRVSIHKQLEVGNGNMYSLPLLVQFIPKLGVEDDITSLKSEIKELSKKR
jgi:hypothetical protein